MRAVSEHNQIQGWSLRGKFSSNLLLILKQTLLWWTNYQHFSNNAKLSPYQFIIVATFIVIIRWFRWRTGAWLAILPSIASSSRRKLLGFSLGLLDGGLCGGLLGPLEPLEYLNIIACTSIGCFPWGNFPKDDPKRKNISFFSILMRWHHLWSHPLVSANFSSHIVFQPLCPTEICQFYPIVLIEQQVQTFEISMEDWFWSLVEIVHSLGCINRESPPLLPADLTPALILQNWPQSSSFTVFKHDCIMRRLRAGSQKHHNIWMPKSLHSMTFTDKIFHRIFIIGINLKNFNSYSSFSPCRFINDTVSSLGNLLAELQFLKWYLHWSIESSRFVNSATIN